MANRSHIDQLPGLPLAKAKRGEPTSDDLFMARAEVYRAAPHDSRRRELTDRTGQVARGAVQAAANSSQNP